MGRRSTRLIEQGAGCFAVKAHSAAGADQSTGVARVSSTRTAIPWAAEQGNQSTADLFTEVSHAFDKNLWSLEPPSTPSAACRPRR